MIVLAFAVLILLAIMAYRQGYRDGHMDGILERHGHGPITPRGRKIHQHLRLYHQERMPPAA